MKKTIIIFTVLFSIFTASNSCNTQLDPITSENKKTVICIGNSITYGVGVANRNTSSYPAVLGKLLGDDYTVFNFGLSGRTMLNKGDYPYMKEEYYQTALTYKPDILIIKLGTNDSKSHNWVYKSEFKQDMTTMVNSFKEQSPHTEIYLCYPAKAYLQDQSSINDVIIVNEIIPIITEAAKDCNVKIIDIHSATDNMRENFPDNIHPNEAGARAIAEKVYSEITH